MSLSVRFACDRHLSSAVEECAWLRLTRRDRVKRRTANEDVGTYAYPNRANLTLIKAPIQKATMRYAADGRFPTKSLRVATTTCPNDGDGLKLTEDSGSGVTTMLWDGTDYLGMKA